MGPSDREQSGSERWGRADDGSLVRLVLAEPADADTLEQRWPSIGLEALAAPTPGHTPALEVVVAGSDVFFDGEPAPGGWDRVESELALFAADRLDDLIAIHAGVVAWRGRVLVLPGPSRAGKSSLCVAAHRAGAAVWSDEYALVDRHGRVRGWRRAVRVRTPAGLDRLDVTVDHEPATPSLVAVLRHDPDQDSAWRDLTPSEAVMDLMANCVSARTRPDEAFDAALAVARSAVAVSGSRGEADVSITRLLQLLDDLDA